MDFTSLYNLFFRPVEIHFSVIVCPLVSHQLLTLRPTWIPRRMRTFRHQATPLWQTHPRIPQKTPLHSAFPINKAPQGRTAGGRVRSARRLWSRTVKIEPPQTWRLTQHWPKVHLNTEELTLSLMPRCLWMDSAPTPNVQRVWMYPCRGRDLTALWGCQHREKPGGAGGALHTAQHYRSRGTRQRSTKRAVKWRRRNRETSRKTSCQALTPRKSGQLPARISPPGRQTLISRMCSSLSPLDSSARCAAVWGTSTAQSAARVGVLPGCLGPPLTPVEGPVGGPGAGDLVLLHLTNSQDLRIHRTALHESFKCLNFTHGCSLFPGTKYIDHLKNISRNIDILFPVNY